jgi:8-amino-7-oxononanoate synthase
MSLFDRWNAVLDALRAAGRYRALQRPCGVDLTSNDYLGYNSGRANAPVNGADLPRSGTASRLLRGHHPIWAGIEAELARWHGAEAVLMMTSGYTANEGLLSTLIEPDDWVASDESNHASLIDGLRLNRPRRFVFRHNDLDHLADGLRADAERLGTAHERFIVTEALFSMDGDRTPLAEIATLAERCGAHLIVDEAHTTGCFGPSGSGRVDELGLRGRVLATVHTGGKALGVPGAYVCGSARMREYLVNRCRHLIFTTAPAPALGAWWLAALHRVQSDGSGRRTLHKNATVFRSALAQRGIEAPGCDYIVPVMAGSDARAVAVSGRLQARGYDIRAVRPPTVPAGTARWRVSVHADHSTALMHDVAAALAEAIREK